MGRCSEIMKMCPEADGDGLGGIFSGCRLGLAVWELGMH